MAVGTQQPLAFEPIAGIRLAAVASHIRYPNRLDLVLMELAENSTVAGVFTRNAFCAAPVQVCREHLAETQPRYLLINTGNANAGTGEPGRIAALDCCRAVAEIAAVDSRQILPFSTGVIGEKLPVERIKSGLPDAFSRLSENNWGEAAQGILTTDTRPKLASRQLQIDGNTITITGMAKGAGMLRPNMATMLCFVGTDAAIAGDESKRLLQQAVERSFNRITVDGDTSTNDSCMLIATGRSGWSCAAGAAGFAGFVDALQDLFQELAMGLIRDAEGATKFVSITVSAAASIEECLKVAYCVAESPLVKTALFAADPNWGRILAAVGRAGIDDLDIEAVSITLGAVPLVSAGAVDPAYSEARGQAEMDRDEISIAIDLGRGTCSETVWTSDLSHDYVRINADYRT